MFSKIQLLKNKNKTNLRNGCIWWEDPLLVSGPGPGPLELLPGSGPAKRIIVKPHKQYMNVIINRPKNAKND